MNTTTYVTERLPECFVCSNKIELWELDCVMDMTVEYLYNRMIEKFKLESPALMSPNGDIIYMKNPAFEEMYHGNLEKTVALLMHEKVLPVKGKGSDESLYILITDKTIKSKMKIKIPLV